MKSDSEQIARPGAVPAGRDYGGILGWCLAATMVLVWLAFWDFWLSPVNPASKTLPATAPRVSFLSRTSSSDGGPGISVRSLRSPAVFSLPSEEGFSAGALTNRIGGRPPLQVPGGEALFLAPSQAAAPGSGFRFAPELDQSVRQVLTNLPDRLSGTRVFPGPAALRTDVQVELSAGLERRRLRVMEVPQDEALLKDKPWEALAFVDFNEEGKVTGVFLEERTSFDDVNAALIRALWRWQVENAKEPFGGRVAFRSPGRPQAAVELQKGAGP